MDPNTLEQNIKKLNDLRALPRGSNVESRMAAIQSLLGSAEIFKTIQNLRWPSGPICPFCHSTEVRIDENIETDPDDPRTYYRCLYCEAHKTGGSFHELSGLSLNGSLDTILIHLQNWILCWYLISFCSLHQIAKLLNLSTIQVMEFIEFGAKFIETPKESKSSGLKEKIERSSEKSQTLQDELYTRSESKNPLKPGYKSQK